jgi:hypothetical protein
MTAPRTRPLFILLACVAFVPGARAEDATPNANTLTLQVNAMEMLFQLEARGDQLDALAKMVTKVKPKDRKREAAKTTDKFLQALNDVRDAYINGDEDKINETKETLDGVRESDPPELDEGVEIATAARKEAAAALKLFTARQVMRFLIDTVGEDFPDPVLKITQTLQDGRGMTGEEWDGTRNAAADEVAWLMAGVNAAAEAKARKQVVELLDRAHALNDADYKAQKKELAQDARKLLGNVGPTDVVRHYLEHALAELLSNAQLGTVLEERLKRVVR